MKRRWDHAREYWRPQNDMYGRLLAFCLDLEHYKTNEGFDKDKRRIQPRTQKQLNLIRHKAALLLRKMPEFDGHAVQPYASAKAAEISRRIIENIFLDPLKGYYDVRSRFVWSALAGGRGNIAIDWHPRAGVVFRFVDPRRFHIAPGCTSLHSPLTPFCVEEVPMRMSELLRMRSAGWDVPSDITPDDWKPGYATGTLRDDSIVDFRDGQSDTLPGADESEESDKIVTVLKSWYRDDPYGRPAKRKTNLDLPVHEWFFLDDATGERVPFDQMSPEPPVSQATGAPMRLVTKDITNLDPGTSEDGFLFITAPFYSGEKPLFEGGWMDGAINQRATLSAFPYMELTCYPNPLRRQGMSDTEATRTLVVVDNASYRATFEQMKQTGAVLITEPGKLLDSEGNQFQFSDDPISIAYAGDRLSLDSVKFFQAPGMNSSMPAFRSMVGESWQHVGTGDFSGSLGPERSKDIAASTVAQLQESGDLPVQLHQQELNQQESIGARVALDLCRAYMGDDVISWVTDEGESVYATVNGSDLVPLRVTITAGREWRQQDIDRVQAQAQFLGMVNQANLPPQAMTVLLREAQFSAPVIEAFAAEMQKQQEMEQQQMQMQQMQGEAGTGGEVPPNGPPPPNQEPEAMPPGGGM